MKNRTEYCRDGCWILVNNVKTQKFQKVGCGEGGRWFGGGVPLKSDLL